MDHLTHNSKIYPVNGCIECDKEIGRPIPRCFGAGRSSVIIPVTVVPDPVVPVPDPDPVVPDPVVPVPDSDPVVPDPVVPDPIK